VGLTDDVELLRGSVVVIDADETTTVEDDVAIASIAPDTGDTATEHVQTTPGFGDTDDVIGSISTVLGVPVDTLTGTCVGLVDVTTLVVIAELTRTTEPF